MEDDHELDAASVWWSDSSPRAARTKSVIYARPSHLLHVISVVPPRARFYAKNLYIKRTASVDLTHDLPTPSRGRPKSGNS